MGRSFSRRDFIGGAKTVALATPFISLVGCSEAEDQDLLSLNGSTMGTTFSIKMSGVPAGLDQGEMAAAVDAALEGVNRQMSTYRPDSELSRFNAAEAGSWVQVSPATAQVIDEALRVSRLTKGAFDPTVGPVVDLWGFGPASNGRQVPNPQEVAALSDSVGFDKVSLRKNPPALSKSNARLGLDLSGVAKGFGVDQVAEVLEAHGVTNYLAEVGGELRSSGQGPGGRSWRVGIEKPVAASGGVQRIVELERAALATSGNYRLFFERDGESYSHIIDPQSGRPVSHGLASATVVADTTMEADALSTALLVLGAEAAMDFAEAQQIAAFLITGPSADHRTLASSRFEKRFGA